MGRISEAVEMNNTLQFRTWVSLRLIEKEAQTKLYHGEVLDMSCLTSFKRQEDSLQNFYMAGIAPLQLYYAGLAFSPEKSIIRQSFNNQISKRVQVLPVDKTWSPKSTDIGRPF